MEESLLARILKKLSVAIISLALVDLLYLNYWVLNSQKTKVLPDDERSDMESVTSVIDSSPSPTPASSPTANTLPKNETAASSPPTNTVIQKETQTIVQNAQKEIFIPIGSGSTFSNSYADLPGLEVTIDASKYSAIDSVVFEASIKVKDNNGKMYARLYEKNVGGVPGSEISTSSGTSVAKTSQKFNIDARGHTYVVQAKTDLVEYSAHVENARIKITLK